MIGIRHNDSGNTAGTNELVKRLGPQRNWIDKIAIIGRHKASRTDFRFDGGIVTVPNGEIWSDYVKIRRRSHARDHRRPARTAQTRANAYIAGLPFLRRGGVAPQRSGEHRLPACSCRQPCRQRLSTRNSEVTWELPGLGKLSRPAGWQPALPRSKRSQPKRLPLKNSP